MIELERSSRHAIIRLNRPNKLNALTHEMFVQLNDKLNQLVHDDELRTLIITASGERAFCAGTDLEELGSTHDGKAISQRGQDLCDRLEDFPVPVIAAINGLAAGGGLELVLACHLRIASTDATFSLPETKLGLIPGYGGTQRLTREIGLGRATEMMLAGRTLTSEEALTSGLVNRVVAAADVLPAAMSLATEIEALSPLSIRACLKAVTKGLERPLNEGLKLERELFASLFETEDAREGTAAFLEKRSPVFKGR